MADSLCDAFSRIHIFAGISQAALELVCSLAQHRTFPEGTVVFKEGDPSGEMYVIEKGTIEILRNGEDGKPLVIASLDEGDFFGEMSLLEARRRCATARCKMAATAHSLRGVDLLRLYHEMPDQYAIIILNIARDLSRRLHALDDYFASHTHC
jgi:CRP/FNR family cyclic AMP-dependent transcriptional regulator